MRDINFKYYFTLNDKVINTKTFIMDDIEDINFNTILFLNIDINKYSIEKMKLYRSQSTGLKDKNGVEIYEGDICKTERSAFREDDKTLGIVEFHNACFMRKIKYLEGMYGYHNLFNLHCEVIGNIYENPELLKEGI